VKFALFATEKPLPRLWSGAIERIGLANGRFHAVDAEGATVLDETRNIADHDVALRLLLDAIEPHTSGAHLAAVGHRVVHGGPECDCPALVTAALEARLRRLIPLAPLHQPHNLAGIAAVRGARRGLPQVACFDTAFHHGLPRLATLTALPRELYDEGVRRYGFHGLSYEYVADVLRRDGVDVDRERIVVAHLGNGASMCALKDGRSVETTMGFSTLAGLPMGTRCGDLDPGIILYLLAEKGMAVEHVQRLLYEESGLLGLSGLSRNMQDLLVRPTQPAAIEAVEAFCYQACRHLAALTAALGGLDRVVFTGGIGANVPLVRAKICAGLDYLGVALDAERNAGGARVISADGGGVAVEAFPTDEELMIARHVRQVLSVQPAAREA
jgi:acetate kinase